MFLWINSFKKQENKDRILSISVSKKNYYLCVFLCIEWKVQIAATAHGLFRFERWDHNPLNPQVNGRYDYLTRRICQVASLVNKMLTLSTKPSTPVIKMQKEDNLLNYLLLLRSKAMFCLIFFTALLLFSVCLIMETKVGGRVKVSLEDRRE